jgi:Flp pilus assembly protein TadG
MTESGPTMPLNRQRFKQEQGTTLVMVALSFSILMGFMALAVDVGLLFRVKRNIQIAADAAATAGAFDYFNSLSSSSAVKAATNAATANGFTTGVNGATVTVINPVTSGAHTGNGVVEVDISEPSPTVFMRVFGHNTMTVGARAVAGNAPGPCIYLMNSTGDDLTMNGSTTIEGINPTTGAVAPGCGIYSNSNVNVSGGSNLVNMAYVAARGSLSGNSNTNPAPVITGAPAETPPSKLNVSPPTKPSSCPLPSGATSKVTGQLTTWTATVSTAPTAGTCFGLGSLSGSTNILNLTLSNVTLPAGNYGFDLGTASTGPHSFGGTLNIGSNVTGPCVLATCQGYSKPPQNAAGITLDVYTGNVSMASTSNNVYLYAPSDSSSYDGILILEPTSNTGTINLQWGSATSAFVGIIDAQGANLTMQDSGGATLVTGMAVGSMTLGPSTLKVENYSSVYSNSPMNSIALVE